MAKWRFQRKHAHIFLIFVDDIQWNSDENWQYLRVFGVKTWKPVVVFIETGVLVDLRPYLQKHVNTTIFRPSFTEYRQQKIKKYGIVSTETVI